MQIFTFEWSFQSGSQIFQIFLMRNGAVLSFKHRWSVRFETSDAHRRKYCHEGRFSALKRFIGAHQTGQIKLHLRIFPSFGAFFRDSDFFRVFH